MTGHSPRTPAWLLGIRVLVLVLLAVATYCGWREFWFLTDDAHITFRYISNSLRGYGYTWNPPPFRPVEGYSNFLWMILLEGVWRAFGIEPPRACNVVSLLLSYGTLALGFRMVWKMELPSQLARFRFSLGVFVLLATLTNRTFLAWTSSGLETALLVFCVTAWVAGLLEWERTRGGVPLALASLAAALSALTRPDGLLLVMGSGFLCLWHLLSQPREQKVRAASAAGPLVLVLAHLLWRHRTYGEWVPNTYFAKHVAAWPQSGIRYSASFILEYALWVWACIGLAALVVWARRERGRRWTEPLCRHLAGLVIFGVLLAHFAYYTFVIGGDHFEYRVYAHLVLLLWVAWVAALATLRMGGKGALALSLAALFLSLPLPWVHYWKTRNLSRKDHTFTFLMVRPLASEFPRLVRPYVAAFDALQGWLIPRFICMRHKEHKVFYEYQTEIFPPRRDSAPWTNVGRPVFVFHSVGVPAWVFPETAIIDLFGLNDRVVARNPLPKSRLGHRKMAHDREPPAGYVECFLPNVEMQNGRALVLSRPTPLTDEIVQSCERQFDNTHDQ